MSDFPSLWNEFIKQFITNKGYESILNGLLITVEIAVFGLIIGLIRRIAANNHALRNGKYMGPAKDDIYGLHYTC